MQPVSPGWRALVLVILGVLSTAGCVPPAENSESDRSADEAAIRAVLDELEAAANASDGDRTAALYTPEGDIWIAGGPRVTGPSDIRQFEEQFYANPEYSGWELSIESIRFVSRDAAVVETSAITRLTSGDMRDRASVIVVRTDGMWKAAAVRVMSVEPVSTSR